MADFENANHVVEEQRAEAVFVAAKVSPDDGSESVPAGGQASNSQSYSQTQSPSMSQSEFGGTTSQHEPVVFLQANAGASSSAQPSPTSPNTLAAARNYVQVGSLLSGASSNKGATTKLTAAEMLERQRMNTLRTAEELGYLPGTSGNKPAIGRGSGSSSTTTTTRALVSTNYDGSTTNLPIPLGNHSTGAPDTPDGSCVVPTSRHSGNTNSKLTAAQLTINALPKATKLLSFEERIRSEESSRQNSHLTTASPQEHSLHQNSLDKSVLSATAQFVNSGNAPAAAAARWSEVDQLRRVSYQSSTSRGSVTSNGGSGGGFNVSTTPGVATSTSQGAGVHFSQQSGTATPLLLRKSVKTLNPYKMDMPEKFTFDAVLLAGEEEEADATASANASSPANQQAKRTSQSSGTSGGSNAKTSNVALVATPQVNATIPGTGESLSPDTPSVSIGVPPEENVPESPGKTKQDDLGKSYMDRLMEVTGYLNRPDTSPAPPEPEVLEKEQSRLEKEEKFAMPSSEEVLVKPAESKKHSSKEQLEPAAGSSSPQPAAAGVEQKTSSSKSSTQAQTTGTNTTPGAPAAASSSGKSQNKQKSGSSGFFGSMFSSLANSSWLSSSSSSSIASTEKRNYGKKNKKKAMEQQEQVQGGPQYAPFSPPSREKENENVLELPAHEKSTNAGGGPPARQKDQKDLQQPSIAEQLEEEVGGSTKERTPPTSVRDLDQLIEVEKVSERQKDPTKETALAATTSSSVKKVDSASSPSAAAGTVEVQQAAPIHPPTKLDLFSSPHVLVQPISSSPSAAMSVGKSQLTPAGMTPALSSSTGGGSGTVFKPARTSGGPAIPSPNSSLPSVEEGPPGASSTSQHGVPSPDTMPMKSTGGDVSNKSQGGTTAAGLLPPTILDLHKNKPSYNSPGTTDLLAQTPSGVAGAPNLTTGEQMLFPNSPLWSPPMSAAAAASSTGVQVQSAGTVNNMSSPMNHEPSATAAAKNSLMNEQDHVQPFLPAQVNTSSASSPQSAFLAPVADPVDPAEKQLIARLVVAEDFEPVVVLEQEIVHLQCPPSFMAITLKDGATNENVWQNALQLPVRFQNLHLYRMEYKNVNALSKTSAIGGMYAPGGSPTITQGDELNPAKQVRNVLEQILVRCPVGKFSSEMPKLRIQTRGSSGRVGFVDKSQEGEKTGEGIFEYTIFFEAEAVAEDVAAVKGTGEEHADQGSAGVDAVDTEVVELFLDCKCCLQGELSVWRKE
ncbi:unnamed protein product [Amoebophrya sp. A120]|nr:unnamed protein product [Amoebophrya sp. A120]|eukprot:GSA120T00010781001.1